MASPTLNKRQFLATSEKPRGGEDKPPYTPGPATARTVEKHKCNIHLGNEALDSYHRATCSDH